VFTVWTTVDAKPPRERDYELPDGF
jgi:hypothetical protein